jgi:hypothetical protein
MAEQNESVRTDNYNKNQEYDIIVYTGKVSHHYGVDTAINK